MQGGAPPTGGSEVPAGPGFVAAHGAAVALVLTATLVRWLLSPILGEQLPFLGYYPAVAMAAWYGGFAPGAVATALAAVAASVPLSASGPPAIAGDAYVVALIVFVLMCLLICMLSEQLHQARREARAAAQTMRETDTRARRLFESNIIGMLYWDAAGGIGDANDAFLTMAGLRRDGIDAATWRGIVAPECRPLHEVALGQIRSRGECDPFDSMIVRSDGTRVPIFCGGVALDRTGSHGITFVLDMTESRRTRDALEESESRYRTLFEDSPIGLMEEDWSGMKRRLDELVAAGHEPLAHLTEHPEEAAACIALIRVTRVNRVALDILGVESAAALDPNIGVYLPPETLQNAGDVLLRAVAGSGRVRIEQTLRTPAGVLREVLIQLSPLPGHEATLDRVLLCIVDISERKQVESEREELLALAERARKEAEAASRTKDEFLATVSHELRTPLSPILAWSRMLREGVLDAGRSTHAYEVIERSARTQAQLIEDLLDVSRIMAGKMRLEVRPVELAPVIERALEVVRPSADAKGLRLQVVLDSEAGAVLGDDGRLQQVVWNLLANAVKFTPKGGRIQVALARVDSHLEIAVSDTGEGMDPAFLPYVFDRFRQADASTTRTQGGLGLGLAIVRHIVEAHGGSVGAASPGRTQGSVFTVQLPVMIARPAGEVTRRHPTARTDADETLPRLDGVRILVLDDEHDSNEVVAELLAARGAEVRQARSPDAARALAAEWPPNLLVSDIGMPGEDGYAFIASWRSRTGDEARIPAVALTAYAGRTDRIRLLSAGFDAHVPKPLDPAELLTVLASLARSHL